MGRKRKGKKSSGGGGILVLLVLLITAGAGGAWNYQRNIALESQDQGPRPFKGYSDSDLEELAAAYSERNEHLNRKYKASLASRKGIQDSGQFITERIDEFERVQKEGDRIRAATSLAADSEARLREIREEQSYRGNQSEMTLHLRRLTSL
jgi:hypothetical protein